MDPIYVNVPLVQSVFHPTDLSPASERAFAHALAVALIRNTRLTILHVGPRFVGSWAELPQVRSTLRRWGFLGKSGPRAEAYGRFNVRVEKIQVGFGTALGTTLRHLEKKPTDLIVLATHGREGLPRWIRPSVAERVARRSNTKTLIVPADAPGFVSLEDGSIRLRRILIPVDRHPDPHVALGYASRIAAVVADEGELEILLLHVGETAPPLALPEAPGCSWQHLVRSGDVVEQVVSVARDQDVDLIMMATAGREGVLDVLRGSVTEQVLRKAPCPLLAIPVE